MINNKDLPTLSVFLSQPYFSDYNLFSKFTLDKESNVSACKTGASFVFFIFFHKHPAGSAPNFGWSGNIFVMVI